ncbi:TonB-dependent receptor [Flavisphingomonas formosensis]|uniref:TonB-dependent receptor n=1 Tax=Flavisphingomonas formosensis TaxID=861534 RepID=UPI001E59912C|nr:TonB-dependent receptor [Sphingomonas formosensis]
MAGAARAQDAPVQTAAAEDMGGLQDIVVTAQKREQNLQKVGISVTAISGQQILQRGISNSIDLITRTPSVDNYSPYGPGSSANIVIRGIGLNDFGEGNEAPVTVYVDEFYVVNVPAVDFALFDLQRAEILRGPQGTLFGRNSTGGLVNYVTEKPGDSFGGYFKASYARFNELKLEGAVNIPISDVLSGRISFLSHHSDGYIRNLNPGFSDQKGGAAGTDAVRAQLRYNDGNWDVLLKAEYGRQNHVHTYYEQTPSVRDPVTGLASLNPNGTDAAGYNEKNFGAGAPNVTDTNRPQRLRSQGTTVILRAEKKLGDVSFTSLTGYQHFVRHYTEDCDASPNDTCYAQFPFKADSASQEFRFFHSGSQLRWTAGVYGLYSKSQNNPFAVFNVPVSGPGAIDPTTGLYDGAYLPLNLAANWKLRTYSLAAFGQGEYDLSSIFTFIAGARLTYDNKHFRDADNASLRSCPGYPTPTNCFPAPDGPGIANPFSGKYSKVLISGKVELDFKPTNNALFYASISRGTKSGGFSNGFYPGGVSTSQLKYGAETNWAYELGEKITFFDRRLRVNSAVFYYDYKNFQTFNWEGVGGLLSNHDASSYGAETEIEAAPIDNLTLSFGGSYLHTKIQDVTNGTPSGGIYTADRQMANAPHWTANGSVTYKIPLADGRAVTLEWDGNYRSARYTNNFNDPSVRLGGYFKHNATVSFDVTDKLQLQGFVRNISNKLAATKAYQFNDLGYTQFIYSEPRVFGGSILYRW